MVRQNLDCSYKGYKQDLKSWLGVQIPKGSIPLRSAKNNSRIAQSGQSIRLLPGESKVRIFLREPNNNVGMPEWPKGTSCNLVKPSVQI